MAFQSDKEILEMILVKESCNYGFNLLVRKYRKQIYWHVRRIVIDHDDSDDVVQNTFIKIWKNINKFREESKLFTWIYRIATNEALNFLKRKRQKLFIPLVDVEEKLSNSLSDDIYFNGDEIQLWASRNDAVTAYVTNFRVLGTHVEAVNEVTGTTS